LSDNLNRFMLKEKKIVLGITGSIAAYKAAYLIRALIKKGAEVQVVITPAGKEFITPTTLSALTNKPVVSHFFSTDDGSWHSHVDLGLWADCMVVAPATAASIGKMAHGIADNMLITTYLAMKAPVFIAPAMDADMYAHPSTQRNLELLKSYGNHIIEPATGFLASTLEGKGRMEEPDEIVRQLELFFSETPFSKKKILITVGPTYEKLDPVRFLGNHSSGKMGFALAKACVMRGASVILIAGPVAMHYPHPLIERIDVESAEEMYDAAVSRFPETAVAILCAAVADFRPAQVATEKIKRDGDRPLNIELVANPDIAAALGRQKRSDQLLVGFALETDHAEANAQEKLRKKNLDLIVLNSLKDEGAGFKTDTNKITLIAASGEKKEFPLKSKQEVANDIIEEIGKRI